MARLVGVLLHLICVCCAADFIGDTECDYRPSMCAPQSSDPTSVAGCLNEGLLGPGIVAAQELAAQVSLTINTTKGSLEQAARVLQRVWSNHPGGIFLSFTLAKNVYDAQYGLMNCSDPSKARDRPFCSHEGLVLYIFDPHLHAGSHEYFAYNLLAGGRPAPSPYWRSTNNSFVPQTSDAYLAVQATRRSQWVPYWKPEEGLVTAAAPILSAPPP
jgi:hypothetical protein